MATDPWAVPAPASSSGGGNRPYIAPRIDNLGDLLDFQRASLQEAIFHRGTSDANRAALRQLLTKLPSNAQMPMGVAEMPVAQFMAMGARAYDKMPHPLQGVYDAMLDAGTDPMTIETLDTGQAVKWGVRFLEGLTHVPVRLIPTAINQANIPRWGPGIISDITAGMRKIFNYGGEAMTKHGRKAVYEATSIANQQKAEEREILRRLQKIDTDAMAKVPKDKRVVVDRLLKNQFPPEQRRALMKIPYIAQAVQSRRLLTDSIIRMQAAGNEGGANLERIVGRKSVHAHGQEYRGATAPSGFNQTVYHGSPKKGLISVRAHGIPGDARQYDNATSRLGAFAAVTPDAAKRYGANLYHGNLNLKKPYEMSWQEFNYLQSPQKSRAGETAFENIHGRANELNEEADQLRKRLQAEGHDGIIVRNSKGEPIEVASFSDIPVKAGAPRYVGKVPIKRVERPLPGLTPTQEKNVDLVLNGKLMPKERENLMRDPFVKRHVYDRITKRFDAQFGTGSAQKAAQDPFLWDKWGRQLSEFGIPVPRLPKYVKGPYGKMKINPEWVKSITPNPNKFKTVARADSEIVPIHADLQHFAGAPGEFEAENFRPNYFPQRGAAKAIEPNQPARTFNPLDRENPHVKPQGEDVPITKKNVQQFEDAFQGMLATSAKAISSNRARAELVKIYGGVDKIPPAIKSLLDVKIPATGTARSISQKLGETLRGVINLPKIGIVGTSPIHMMNIFALLLAHDPLAIPEAFSHMVKIMRAGGDEAKRFQAMLPAIERGIDVAAHAKGGYFLEHVPGIKQMNRMTWNWDVAAKWARSSSYIRQGYSAREAGIMAANDLVNYGNISPAAHFLKWVLPFSTFAEGGAKSVLAATARNPALVENINRLTGGVFLGGGSHGQGVTTYQPPANVGRAIPMPQNGPIPDNTLTQIATLPLRMAMPYVKSKTTDLYKLPLAFGADLLPGGRGRGFASWLLGGESLGGKTFDLMTGPLPFVRDISNVVPVGATGKSIRGYPIDSPLNAGVFSTTGISLPNSVKFPKMPWEKATTPAAQRTPNPNDPWDTGAGPAPTATPKAPKASATSTPPAADPWAVGTPPP